MTTIGLLSDTHGYLDPKIFKYLETCDEIWHAGDIGDLAVTDALSNIKPLRVVYGNIDGAAFRKRFKETLNFRIEGVNVLMTHIGGAAGSYSPKVRALLSEIKPQIFICGHSHILKVMFDKKYNVLYINPGAAGNHGFHKVKTLLRFKIDKNDIKDLEVIELGPR